MNYLGFTMAIVNDEQRRLDQESLNEDIAQMDKVFKIYLLFIVVIDLLLFFS